MLVGVDVDPTPIAECSKTYGSVLMVADGLSLPFREQSFDVVTCFEVIEHVADPLLLLENIKRVLRPGAALIISTPNRRANTPWWPTNACASLSSPFHLREYTPDSLLRLLSRSFSEVELYGQWRVNLLRRKTLYSIKAALSLAPFLFRFIERIRAREAAGRALPVLGAEYGEVEDFRNSVTETHACLLAFCRY